VPQQVLSTETDALDLKQGFEGRIVDYPKFASFHLSRPFPEYKRFRTVMLPWDNTARYGLRAMVHINGQGDAYKLWLMQALLDTYRRYPPDERIVLLHSWNEWCESTYLEPDGKFGRMYLEQTGEAIRSVRQAIDLMASTPESVRVIAELLRVMQAKDEGAFRVMQATRAQNAYLWRDLEQTRNAEKLGRAELEQARAELEQARSAERLVRTQLDTLYASRSWRITEPLRAINARLHGRS
jgi:lipopolysaccharide biosynthesis protein